MLFEFENNYNLDTGDLLQIFYASGIHLQKDITLSFSFVDPQGRLVATDLDLRNNPLIENIKYDILNINGETLYENYKEGLTRTFSLTEIENIALFGEYKKDFGIRSTVSNFINDNKFISEYYLYGNYPKISGVFALDGSGYKNYDNNLSYNLINTDFIYDQVQLNIAFYNDPKYVAYDYIDIYKINNENKEIINENFIYRYSIINNSDLFNIEINQNYLNTGLHDLILVPYSKIGSGDPFYINDILLKSSETGVISEDTQNIVDVEELVKINLITGFFINDNDEIIDIIENNNYRVIKYTTQIIDDAKLSSSELKIIIYDTGLNSVPSLIEYGFGDNNFMNYRLQVAESNIYLLANGANKGSFYKLYKTSI